MKVRIADLPADVTEEDIRGLLDDSEHVENIELVADEDSKRPIAIVETTSDAAGDAIVQLVNGRNWKGVTLRSDKLLY